MESSDGSASQRAFHCQPLHADTFTDVLASVAAQWTPADARQPDLQWSSQPDAQWTSSLPEPSPFKEEGSAHGSAHGGNYYNQVRHLAERSGHRCGQLFYSFCEMRTSGNKS